MAENKKSFVLYCDLIHTIEKMPSDKAGDLFKHILRYVNDLNPVSEDLIIELVFEPIKRQMKRDLAKWEDEIKRKSEAGKKGMEKRWKTHNENKTVITEHNTVINSITGITDNVTVNVNDTVNVNEEVRKEDNRPPTNLKNPVSSANNCMLSFDETYKEFMTSQSWQEKFCMDHNLDIEFIKSDMKLFLQEQDKQDQFPRKLSETKFHYTKRLEKYLNKRKEEEIKKVKRTQKIPTL